MSDEDHNNEKSHLVLKRPLTYMCLTSELVPSRFFGVFFLNKYSKSSKKCNKTVLATEGMKLFEHVKDIIRLNTVQKEGPSHSYLSPPPFAIIAPRTHTHTCTVPSKQPHRS